MPDAYRPADRDIPQYFLPMLDDQDRNCKYREAITAAIVQFQQEQGRRPTVLDVGVGTGMLSAICLEAGCERVTGIDTNMTMCHLAQNNLKSVAKWLRGIGRKGVRYEVLHCENGKPPADLRSREFDMMVSEILGTLTTSESMFKFIKKYSEAHLRTFGQQKRVYVVPQLTKQHFAVYSISRAVLGALGDVLDATLEATVNGQEGRFIPTNDGGLGLHLHLYPAQRIGELRTFHTEDYSCWPFEQRDSYHERKEPIRLHPEGDVEEEYLTLGLLEWDVTLWPGVELSNTMDEYRRMSHRNALARAAAWGFFALRLPQSSGIFAETTVGALHTLKIYKQNALNAAKPKILVDGVEFSDVVDSPQPQVAMAADTALAASFIAAIDAAGKAHGLPRPGANKMLIVNDISCGAIAVAAADRGWRVTTVNEDSHVADAVEVVVGGQAARRGLRLVSATGSGIDEESHFDHAMPITDGEQRANTLAYAHARREASLEFDAAVTACLEERAEQSFACMPLDGVRTKTRCYSCQGCFIHRTLAARVDCGRCMHCLDKPKFGGPNTSKQTCLLKTCERSGKLRAVRMDAASRNTSLPDWMPEWARHDAGFLEAALAAAIDATRAEAPLLEEGPAACLGASEVAEAKSSSLEVHGELHDSQPVPSRAGANDVDVCRSSDEDGSMPEATSCGIASLAPCFLAIGCHASGARRMANETSATASRSDYDTPFSMDGVVASSETWSSAAAGQTTRGVPVAGAEVDEVSLAETCSTASSEVAHLRSSDPPAGHNKARRIAAPDHTMAHRDVQGEAAGSLSANAAATASGAGECEPDMGWQVPVCLKGRVGTLRHHGERTSRSQHRLQRGTGAGPFDMVLFPALLLDALNGKWAEGDEGLVQPVAATQAAPATAHVEEERTGGFLSWLSDSSDVRRLRDAQDICVTHLGGGGLRIPASFDPRAACPRVELSARVASIRSAAPVPELACAGLLGALTFLSSKLRSSKPSTSHLRTVRGDQNLLVSSLYLLDFGRSVAAADSQAGVGLASQSLREPSLRRSARGRRQCTTERRSAPAAASGRSCGSGAASIVPTEETDLRLSIRESRLQLLDDETLQMVRSVQAHDIAPQLRDSGGLVGNGDGNAICGYGDASCSIIDVSLDTLSRMSADDAPDELRRSAVARATYHGFGVSFRSNTAVSVARDPSELDVRSSLQPSSLETYQATSVSGARFMPREDAVIKRRGERGESFGDIAQELACRTPGVVENRWEWLVAHCKVNQSMRNEHISQRQVAGTSRAGEGAGGAPQPTYTQSRSTKPTTGGEVELQNSTSTPSAGAVDQRVGGGRSPVRESEEVVARHGYAREDDAQDDSERVYYGASEESGGPSLGRFELWSPEEEQLLWTLRNDGKSFEYISSELGRTRKAVEQKFSKMRRRPLCAGAPDGVRRWTREEVEGLRVLRGSGRSWKSISAEMGRTVGAVQKKGQEMHASARSFPIASADDHRSTVLASDAPRTDPADVLQGVGVDLSQGLHDNESEDGEGDTIRGDATADFPAPRREEGSVSHSADVLQGHVAGSTCGMHHVDSEDGQGVAMSGGPTVVAATSPLEEFSGTDPVHVSHGHSVDSGHSTHQVEIEDWQEVATRGAPTMPPPAPRRKEGKGAVDTSEVYELHQKGEDALTIAKTLGCTENAVWLMLCHHQKRLDWPQRLRRAPAASHIIEVVCTPGRAPAAPLRGSNSSKRMHNAINEDDRASTVIDGSIVPSLTALRDDVCLSSKPCGRRWTREEEHKLHSLLANGSSWEAMASEMGRTPAALQRKMRHLHASAPQSQIERAAETESTLPTSEWTQTGPGGMLAGLDADDSSKGIQQVASDNRQGVCGTTSTVPNSRREGGGLVLWQKVHELHVQGDGLQTIANKVGRPEMSIQLMLDQYRKWQERQTRIRRDVAASQGIQAASMPGRALAPTIERRPWTEEERFRVAQAFASGQSTDDLEKSLGRSAKGLKQFAFCARQHPAKHKPCRHLWLEEDFILLIDGMKARTPIEEIASQLDFTTVAVRSKWNFLMNQDASDHSAPRRIVRDDEQGQPTESSQWCQEAPEHSPSKSNGQLYLTRISRAVERMVTMGLLRGQDGRARASASPSAQGAQLGAFSDADQSVFAYSGDTAHAASEALHLGEHGVALAEAFGAPGAPVPIQEACVGAAIARCKKTRWRHADEAELLRLHATGMSVADLAKHFDRTTESTSKKMEQLKGRCRPQRADAAVRLTEHGVRASHRNQDNSCEMCTSSEQYLTSVPSLACGELEARPVTEANTCGLEGVDDAAVTADVRKRKKARRGGAEEQSPLFGSNAESDEASIEINRSVESVDGATANTDEDGEARRPCGIASFVPIARRAIRPRSALEGSGGKEQGRDQGCKRRREQLEAAESSEDASGNLGRRRVCTTSGTEVDARSSKAKAGSSRQVAQYPRSQVQEAIGGPRISPRDRLVSRPLVAPRALNRGAERRSVCPQMIMRSQASAKPVRSRSLTTSAAIDATSPGGRGSRLSKQRTCPALQTTMSDRPPRCATCRDLREYEFSRRVESYDGVLLQWSEKSDTGYLGVGRPWATAKRRYHDYYTIRAQAAELEAAGIQRKFNSAAEAAAAYARLQECRKSRAEASSIAERATAPSSPIEHATPPSSPSERAFTRPRLAFPPMMDVAAVSRMAANDVKEELGRFGIKCARDAHANKEMLTVAILQRLAHVGTNGQRTRGGTAAPP